MSSLNPQQILSDALATARDEGKHEIEALLTEGQTADLQTVIDHAETQKAVIAALMTSLTKKILSPEQDVRQHKIELSGGYSGRVFDTNYVTPFIRRHFPRLAMQSGSGWLTRSIEQVAPFTQDFPGRIQNPDVKRAFLAILHDIEANQASPYPYLIGLMRGLVRFVRRDLEIASVRPDLLPVTVAQIMSLLDAHFHYRYRIAGASRLPVLALHAIYELLLETPRYRGKQLLPLKGHTTSDTKSGTIGDIEIIHAGGDYFEAVEVKFDIPISDTLIEIAYAKIYQTGMSCFYLLTTAEPNTRDPQQVASLTARLTEESGIEIIVNGLMPSLKYYLRLLPDRARFIALYTEKLQRDFERGTDIKRTHLEMWQKLLSSGM